MSPGPYTHVTWSW